MTSMGPPAEESVLRELNRRRVVRVMVAYLALCFGGLTLAHLLLTLLSGPAWGFRVILGAAALGFPLTAVLAWTYDITPHGIVRTPDYPHMAEPEQPVPRWAWGATVAVGLLTGIVSLALRRVLL